MTSAPFSEVTSEELGETLLRCSRCATVVIPEEKDAHVCPPTEEEARIERFEAELKDTFDRFCNENILWEERMFALNLYERMLNERKERILKKAERKFTLEVLHGMIAKEFERRLDSLKRMEDREYQKMDDMRAKGIPYVERMALFDKRKLEWCQKQRERYQAALKAFRPLPIRQWLTDGGISLARDRGMGRVIELFLEETYQITN